MLASVGADADRDGGQKFLAEVSDVLSDLPIVNAYLARVRARRGDRDDAVPLIRAATDHLFREGQLLAWGIQRPVFWWRHWWIAGPRVTWPKPWPPSSG